MKDKFLDFDVLKNNSFVIRFMIITLEVVTKMVDCCELRGEVLNVTLCFDGEARMFAD